MTRKHLFSIFVFLFLGSTYSWAATWTYPGSCVFSLQSCVNSAQTGDVIQLTSPLNEDVTITRSLTLMPAPGFAAPVIGNDNFIVRKITVADDPQGGDIHVRFFQLHLKNARIEVIFDSAPGFSHEFSLEDSIIELNQAGQSAITLTESVSNFSNFARNKIISSGWGIRVVSNLPFENESATYVLANTITSQNPLLSLGGINFNQLGSGGSYRSVFNNLIYSVAGSAASTGAILVQNQGSSWTNYQIRNNTIDEIDSGHGIFIPAKSADSGLSALVQSNIVTNISGNWLQLGVPQANYEILEDYNTYYLAGNTGYNGAAAGTQTFLQNPQFVDRPNRNYNLGQLSPCLNSAGAPLWSLWIPATDLQNRPRELGGESDRGALERWADSSATYVLFSDTFEDNVVTPGYTYVKGSWMEDKQNLLGVPDKQAHVQFSNAPSCDLCSVTVDIRLTPPVTTGVTGKIWIQGWYVDKNNYVELMIVPETGKYLLRQKSNGAIVAKAKNVYPHDFYASNHLTIKYDGTAFVVSYGEFGGGTLLTMPASNVPAGGFGFKTKGTIGYLSDIFVTQ